VEMTFPVTAPPAVALPPQAMPVPGPSSPSTPAR